MLEGHQQVIFYSRLVCVEIRLPGGVELRRLDRCHKWKRKKGNVFVFCLFFLGPINIFLRSSHRETILLRDQDGSLSMHRLVGAGPGSGDRDVKIEMNILYRIFFYVYYLYTYVLKIDGYVCTCALT